MNLPISRTDRKAWAVPVTIVSTTRRTVRASPEEAGRCTQRPSARLRVKLLEGITTCTTLTGGPRPWSPTARWRLSAQARGHSSSLDRRFRARVIMEATGPATFTPTGTPCGCPLQVRNCHPSLYSAFVCAHKPDSFPH